MEPITNERLTPFVISAKNFIATMTPRSNKLWFALDKLLKKSLKKLKKLELARDEKRREFALKKEKGAYDLDANGNYQFDEEGSKKVNVAFMQLDEQDSGVEPHIIPEGEYDDSKMSFDHRNSFEGIVIPAIDYDNLDWDNLPLKKEEPQPAK